MTIDTDQRKYQTYVIFLCWMVYFASYLTRINYSAVVSEIVSAEGLSKTAASIAVTGSFVTYGAGQLICGLLGDKYKPRNLIFIGLCITSVTNILMPCTLCVPLMTAIWCINGFAQSMLWPPLVRMMVDLLPAEAFKRACVHISIASSAGTITVYLLAPVCIRVLNWRYVFWIAAAFCICVICNWMRGTRRIENWRRAGIVRTADAAAPADRKTPASPKENAPEEKMRENPDKTSLYKLFTSSGLFFMAIAIVLQGILKDGLLTWIPSYISETYDLSTSLAVLVSVALPIFSIISVSLASMLNRIIRSEATCAAAIFAFGACSCALLAVFFSFSPYTSVLLAGITTGCMHGVNLMLISRVPAHFARYGRTSTVSGMLNTFTYLGSAISTYGIAAVTEAFGWQTSVICWAAAAVLGTIACVFSIRRWRGFTARAGSRPE